MSGNCVARIACPTCGDENSLQVFEEDGVRTGYCFQPTCKTYYNTQALSSLPDSDAVYIPQEPKDISWVDGLGTFDHPARGLLRGAYKHFGVKHGLSTSDGKTLTETYYPRRIKHDTTGYKVRLHDPKKFYTVGSVRNADPFGWKEALEIGGYSLYVTEGEEDSVAMFTAWMRHKKQKVAVISLAQGADSVIKTLQPVLKDITDKWKQVVFCPDYDEKAGDVAVKAIIALFPEDYTVKIAKYSEKDANDMVLMGKEAELVSSCYNAGVPLSVGVVVPDSDMFAELKVPLAFGKSYPWATLTKLTRGQREGEVIYWGAPPKGGKTTLVNHLAGWNIMEHNQKVLIVSPESSPKATLRRLAGSLVNKVFHDPNIVVNPDDVDKAQGIIGEKVHLFDKWQTPDWTSTRQLIKEEVLLQGIKTVYIDPITNFTTKMNSSERNDFLISMTRELAEDAANYGFTAHVFCHYNKAPKGDKQWSQGRIPTSDDFAGSSAMAQTCNAAIGLQVWKITEGEDKEYLNSQRVLHILEDREFGVAEAIPLTWKPSKGKLEEQEHDDGNS
jgi:twinkle protein